MSDDDAAFALLSRQITRASGFALEAYKDKCIRRRIAVRMRACGVHTYEDYRALLAGSPHEYERLRDALTINVTRFYRNAETWSLVRGVLLPELLGRPRGELRAWSAGCASGEEPYTLVVLAADYLDGANRGDELARVTVDATDIDRVSLERAQAGCYRNEAVAELPDDLPHRYFEAAGPCRRVVERARRRVLVRHLDLSAEPPPRLEYDLILCRNVVIYFDRPSRNACSRPSPGRWPPGGFWCWARWRRCSGRRATASPWWTRASGSTGAPPHERRDHRSRRGPARGHRRRHPDDRRPGQLCGDSAPRPCRPGWADWPTCCSPRPRSAGPMRTRPSSRRRPCRACWS